MDGGLFDWVTLELSVLLEARLLRFSFLLHTGVRTEINLGDQDIATHRT